MDPAALRREYEAKSAENVGDEKLLAHMKKIIISAPSGMLSCGHACSFAVTAYTHTLFVGAYTTATSHHTTCYHIECDDKHVREETE